MSYARLGSLCVAFLLLFTATGCFTVQYSIPSELDPTTYDIIDSFEEKKRASWVILGLVPVGEAEVEEIIEREVRRSGGDAATNVIVTAQFDVVDVIIGALVGGIFNTRTYIVEGDVVRLPNGIGSLAPEEQRSLIVGGITFQRAPVTE
ncbi:MAG: hypothetical protein AAGI71_00235 [Bacteroidota bacterium]